MAAASSPLKLAARVAGLALLPLALTLSAGLAEAKMFNNAYISFELPDTWNCVLEQTEWVCRPSAADQAQQAIIILTAKEVGPSDSLPAYEAHLKAPRQIQSRTGQLITSEVLNVYVNKIQDQPWVDGFHKSSEIPNYLTRYLATTKDNRIAVLITFSAHTLYYSKYANDFLKAIKSLRVIAPKGGGGAGGAGGDGSMFGTGGQAQMYEGDAPPEEGSGEGGGGNLSDKTKLILALAVILAGAGVYLMVKKKKKKPTARR